MRNKNSLRRGVLSASNKTEVGNPSFGHALPDGLAVCLPTYGGLRWSFYGALKRPLKSMLRYI